jgi:hypothetical protein
MALEQTLPWRSTFKKFRIESMLPLSTGAAKLLKTSMMLIPRLNPPEAVGGEVEVVEVEDVGIPAHQEDGEVAFECLFQHNSA